ncbi:MAG TPA: hypothetical protein VMN79_04940 [Casimicrobiaceae bacterium]|nr:hypothetical protein [Casimicrobiaceae bacterium]
MQTTALALEHLLCAVGDPISEIRDIGPGHPEFVRAQILRAAAGVLAKVPDALPAIAQAIRGVEELAVSPRTRTHLAAAQAWFAGNPLLAAESYAFILSRWPTDLLALRLAQSCYFFLGQHERQCRIVDDVAPAWSRDQQGVRFVLGMAAFAYAESGNTGQAETLGRRALVDEPACPMAVHAVAHALAESGRHREGACWMREQHAHWAGDSRMRTHNAWHLAMFDVEEGNVDAALAILDDCLLPACAGSQLDACDAAGLLWRLASEGVDDRGRWAKISEVFARTVTPGFWPFVDLHAALAHACAANATRLQRLAGAIERCAQGGGYAALRARLVTLPGLRALEAWDRGRYGDAAKLLTALRPFLGDAGGSGIQLELFRDIEREATRRQRALPSERIAA